MGYGDGSVYQRHNDDCPTPDDDGNRARHKCRGPWVGALTAGWNERGKRRRVTVTGKTEADVKRRLRDKRNAIAKAGESPQAHAIRKTVKSWADEWLEIRQAKVRPKTWEGDRTAIRQWVIPTIGTKRLVDLAPRDVRAVHAAERNAGHGPASLRRTHWTLIRMLRDAAADGYVVPANVTATEAPAKPESDREALESIQAIAVLHHAADLPHGSRWLVGFFQGLRQGEVLGLTASAIDFARGTIAVEWQLQPLAYRDPKDRSRGFRVPDAYTARHIVGRFHLVRPKTRTGYRVIPMVPEVRDVLEAACAAIDWETNPTGLLWTRGNGWPVDKAHDAAEFRELQQAAGVRHPRGRPFYVHEIRNTTATLLMEAGVDEVTITAILGHSSYATSRGYMTARLDQRLKALEDVAAAFRPKEIG